MNGDMRVEYTPLSEIRGWPRNPKTHDHEAIQESIRRFGFNDPPTIDEGTKQLVEGHGRVNALIALRDAGGEPPKRIRLDGAEWLVPVVRGVSFDSAAAAQSYLLAHNRLVEQGGWDAEALVAMLTDVRSEGVEIIGWSQDDLNALLAPPPVEILLIDDPVPDVPKVPVTQPGDVWRLGDHRLFCGDATQRESWAFNFDAVFTSPPYALGVLAGRLRLRSASGVDRSAYDGHDDDPAKWGALMRGWMTIALELAGLTAINVQMLAGNKRALAEVVYEHRDQLCDVIVWDKGKAQPAMSPGVLNSRFEFIYLFGATDATRVVPFSGFRGTEDNVYAAGGASASDKVTDDHGAVFPAHLPAYVFKLASKARVWADPFMGTGTSLVVAEQLGLVCHGIEMSPGYCDVIVQRWEQLTGRKATRA